MKTILITGCSSGFGLATASLFHARGWNVVATMRTPREGMLPQSERMRVLPLDVTDPASIAALVEAARADRRARQQCRHRPVERGRGQRLMRELTAPRPGDALLASHLAQALLVEAFRAHLEDGRESLGWLAAFSVPPLHRALAAMHANFARRWTLRDLSDVAGMSRSSFAAHFERVTGETPIAYLTRWRMLLAADRLATSLFSLSEIAASIGYDLESASGAAFKRVMGRLPRQYRSKA